MIPEVPFCYYVTMDILDACRCSDLTKPLGYYQEEIREELQLD